MNQKLKLLFFAISPFIFQFLLIDVWELSTKYFEIQFFTVPIAPILFIIYWFWTGKVSAKQGLSQFTSLTYLHSLMFIALLLSSIKSLNSSILTVISEGFYKLLPFYLYFDSIFICNAFTLLILILIFAMGYKANVQKNF